MVNLDNFFKPQRIVIIGVSRDSHKVGHVLFANLLESNYSGKVFIVNKNAEEIRGHVSYPSVLDVPELPDLAIVAVPASSVLEVVTQCGKKGIKDLLIVTSGFGEIGNTKLEEQLKTLIQKNKMRMIGPNCLGIFDGHSGMDALFLPRSRLKRPKGGGISLVCQSGAVGSALLDLATRRGHRFAKFISYGNATSLDETDIIEYLSHDSSTKVICLYVEAVKDGKKFLQIMKNVTTRKPVIAIKGGITEEGSKAALSHTGSLAGDAAVYFGVFKQTGVIYAEFLHDLLNYASIFEHSLPPKGNRVQIITNGGGYGILSTDAISLTKNLRLATFSKKTYTILKKKFPPLLSLANPLDLVGDATTERYQIALDACMNDKSIDIILLIALYQTPLVTPDLVDVITNAYLLKKKPLIVVSTGGAFTEHLIATLEQHGVVTFIFPEEAVRALSAFVSYYLH